MKGWLANHSEDSFAKAKQGQRALLCPQQRDWLPQALPRRNPSPLGSGAWRQLPAVGFIVVQLQTSPVKRE